MSLRAAAFEQLLAGSPGQARVNDQSYRPASAQAAASVLVSASRA